MPTIGKQFDIKELDGRWQSVLADFGINVDTKPGKPCPACGGKDRFHYTDKHRNGTYICRHCTPEGSDGVGLIAKVKGIDRKQAYKDIATRYGTYEAMTKLPEPTPPSPEQQFKQLPIPKDNQWDRTSLVNKPKRYKFKHVWEWIDPATGELFGYVARMEFGSGKKLAWQILYGESPDGTGWHQAAATTKPLFCNKEIIAFDENILIVEGEKTQQAVSKILPDDWAVVCVQGGAQHVKRTDLSVLKSFQGNIYSWADNDDAGRKHMQDIANELGELKTVNLSAVLDDDTKSGWDLADAIDEGWTGKQIAELTQQHSVTLEESHAVVVQKAIQEHNAQAPDKFQELLDTIRPLGLHEGDYCFNSIHQRALKVYSGTELSSKGNLMGLAGKQLLMECFPKMGPNGAATPIVTGKQ